MGSNPTASTKLNSSMKAKVAVFVNHPQCSVQSAHGIVRTLTGTFDVDCIGRHQLRDRILKKYDLLAVPGGIGDSDTWHDIIEPCQDSIANHILRGKRYLGICMGAYWAGSHYLNLLNGVDTVQYIKRPDSDVKRSWGTVTEVDWLGVKESMYFYDGCAFVDTGGSYDVVARYKNNDPAAIIQGNLGLIGPHPESDIYWYDRSGIKPYWHEYRHHQLLFDFVQRLMSL